MVKFKVFVFKLLGIKYGPFLIPIRDYYIFIDNHQRLWEIKPTHRHDIPLSITLVKR